VIAVAIAMMPSPKSAAANLCPLCGEELPIESINISEGVALCPSCGKLSRLADVAERRRPMAELIAQPPKGCSIRDWGQNVIIRVNQRSVSAFAFLLFFSLFWNGITSVFVLLAVAGLYVNLIGPVPNWFPAPPNNPGMGLGESLFLTVFITPFVLIGLFTMGAALMNLCGKAEVWLADREAAVHTGIGLLVWRRRFDPTAVRGVTIGNNTWQSNEKTSPVIVIEADRTIKFGSMLPDDRREWLQAILHQWFNITDPNQRLELLSLARRATSGF
jgi:hypothetical protein